MTEPTLKIGTTGYKLNPEKLVGAPQNVLPYILGCFYFKEEYEYFDVIKDYLDIPEEPKSPAEEAYKEVYGWYPPTTSSVSNYEDNRWSAFQNGYTSATGN
jgi:hypothetical protein